MHNTSRELVSIIIPAYNRARFLESLTLPSVMRQTYVPIECIIVDDGSIDDTKSVVEKFVDNGKVAIKYIFQENKGQGSARNTAIREARGAWILPLDSDDALLSDAVETLVGAAEHEKADIVWARTWRVQGKRKKILGIGSSTPSSVLLAKRIFDKYGLYDENREILEDVDHLYRLRPELASGAVRLANIGTPTSIYFLHAEQSTSLNNPAYLLTKANAMLKKWASHPKAERNDVARWWRNKGSYEILLGERKNGLQSIAHSLSLEFSWTTLFLLVIAAGGRYIFKGIVVLSRGFFARMSYITSEVLFELGHHVDAERRKRELKNILSGISEQS